MVDFDRGLRLGLLLSAFDNRLQLLTLPDHA
jgi:hypothetical protein